MTRPLLVIFLTIFVNLVGFGIIIPLLPFYAAACTTYYFSGRCETEHYDVEVLAAAVAQCPVEELAADGPDRWECRARAPAKPLRGVGRAAAR